jgi:hypothetical protein
MSVTVSLSKALICFAGHCYPALVGVHTPTGSFDMIERRVVSAGYGGDVIQFSEQSTIVYSIHRLWLGNPSQRRDKRILSEDSKDRINITNGCINVQPDVFELLKSCCIQEKLDIVY